MKNRLLLLLIIACSFSNSDLIGQSKDKMRAQEGERVLILINNIKEVAKEDYEKFMDEFFDLLLHDKSPILREQYLKSRWLTPVSQNHDKTWTYIFIMDPYVEDGNYEFEPLFERRYSKEETRKRIALHDSFFQTPQKAIFQIQTRH